MRRRFLVAAGLGVAVALAFLVGLAPGGTPQVAAQATENCFDAADNDLDGKVNDGCPVRNNTSHNEGDDSEGDTGDGDSDQCDDTRDNDADGPGFAGNVNDGCPSAGPAVGTAKEDNWQCHNLLDDDGDTTANDGCGAPGDPVAAGGPQSEQQDACANALDDDDLDGRINDGCPAVAPTAIVGPTGPVRASIACSGPANFSAIAVVTWTPDPPGGGFRVWCRDGAINQWVDDIPDGATDVHVQLTVSTNPTNTCTLDVTGSEFSAGFNKTLPCTVDSSTGTFTINTLAVGGVGELPGLAETAAQGSGAPSGGSGLSGATYAALAGGLAAAMVGLGAGAWYARRRWLR